MGRAAELQAPGVVPALAWGHADASSGNSQGHSGWFADFVKTPGGSFLWGIVGSMVGTFITTLIVLAIGFIRIHGFRSWMEPAAKLAKLMAEKLRQCAQIWRAEDHGSQFSNLQAVIAEVEGSNRAAVKGFQQSKREVIEELERAGMATARSLERVAEKVSELRYAVAAVCSILADFNNNVDFLEEQQWRKNVGADPQYSLILSPSRRGLALIFSMPRDRRRSSVVDEGSARTLPGGVRCPVGLDARMHIDYTADRIRQVVGDMAQHVWATDECFLCCLNAHGGVGRDRQHFILDTQGGRLLLLRDVVEPIRKCASLVGKPLVFAINICHDPNTIPLGPVVVEQQCSPPHGQGDNRGVMQQQWEEDGPGKEVQAYLQNVPDCLLLISSSQDSVWSRETGKTTSFVNALVDGILLRRHTTDLLSIALRVSKFVVNTTGGRRPVVVSSSLRKPLYWRGIYS